MQVKKDKEERFQLPESNSDSKQSKQHDDQLNKQMLLNCLRDIKRGQEAVMTILEFLLKRDGLLIDDCTSTSEGSRSPDTARADLLLAHIHDRVPDIQLPPEPSSNSLILLNSPPLAPLAPEDSTVSPTRKPSENGPKRNSKQSLLWKPTLNLKAEEVKQGEVKQGESSHGTLSSSRTTWGNSKSGSTLDNRPRLDSITESSRESTQPGRIHPRGERLRTQWVDQHDKPSELNVGERRFKAREDSRIN